MRNSRAKSLNLTEDRIGAIKAIARYYIACWEYEKEYEKLGELREKSYSQYWEAIKPAQSKRDNAKRRYERDAAEYEEELIKDMRLFGTDPIKYAREHNLVDFPIGMIQA